MKKPSYAVSGNVNWCSYYGKQYGGSLKTKNSYYYDLVIVLMEKMKTLIQKDTCTPKFIATLFTIAKTQKQPKCLSVEEWIKKMWYTEKKHKPQEYAVHIYNRILLSFKQRVKNAI